MASRPRFYEMAEVLDPEHPGIGATAAHPKEAMWAAMCHLLRYVSGLKVGAISLCLRFVFEPAAHSPQSRLRILLGVCARGRRQFDAIESVILRGTLAHLYPLKPATCPGIPDELTAACHLFRSHQVQAPMVSAEFNAEVPQAYFSCSPFVPDTRNDYATLDRVLDGITEKVVADVAVQPAEAAESREHHGHYVSRLTGIGRSWIASEESYLGEDPLGDAPCSRDEQTDLTPLHQADHTAQSVLYQQQRFHEQLAQPQLAFHAVVLAEKEETARVVGSVLAEAAFLEGSYGICVHAEEQVVRRIGQELNDVNVFAPRLLPSVQTQKAEFEDRGLLPLLHIASVDELAGLFRFPVASCGSLCCMRRNTDPPGHTQVPSVVFGWDVSGSHMASQRRRVISLSALCRHLFISGTTGVGKTTLLFNLLSQLWAQGIPVLVLEPVKTEFRGIKSFIGHTNPELVALARDLELYTPGNEALNALRFNPLEVPPGISMAEHLDAVVGCFEAAMPLGGPLSSLLREALEDLLMSDAQPTLQALLRRAEEALRRKRYSASTEADLRGALETRLASLTRGGLGRALRGSHSVPAVEDMLSRPAVIEMDRLSRDGACLLTLLLFLRIRQVVRAAGAASRHPRLVVIIDEAHNLVGPNTEAKASESFPDPQAYASDFICRMLAEMRALGVAVVISDQTPSAVAAEVVKLPATKIVFQQPDEADRTVMGAGMLFQRQEFEDVARLQPGEAYLFSSGYHRAQKIRTVNLHESGGLRPLDDATLQKHISAEPWYIAAQEARVRSDLESLHTSINSFDRQRLECAAQAAQLCARQPGMIAMAAPSHRIRAHIAIRAQAIQLKEKLEDMHRQFRVRDYEPLLPSVTVVRSAGVELEAIRAALVDRYETVIRPDIEQCLAILSRLIGNRITSIERKHAL